MSFSELTLYPIRRNVCLANIEIIIPGTANSTAYHIKLVGPKLISSKPAIHVVIMIERLNIHDCTDMATSLPLSTWFPTAAWNNVTNGPNDNPHKKKPNCEIPMAPLKK